MKYITFKNDKISKLSLGTVQFGLDYGIANTSGKPSQKDVTEIINYVTNNGINCFDTAQGYGDAEKVLGNSLPNNKNLFIVSKVESSLFRTNIQANISTSLKNLNIDSLYALLLHDSKILHDWKENDSLIVDNLIKNSKIKHFGISIYTSEDFNLAIENDKINFIQIPFNIFDQRAIKEDWFHRAKEKNKLISIRSIYLQGLLLMEKDKIPPQLQSVKKHLDTLNAFAKELHITKNELALSFVDTVAQNSLILFGCDNINQAKENIQNYKNIKKLDHDMITKIIANFENIEEEIYNPIRWSKWQNK
ncbi:aldo/keto reductase [Sulfurimonas autotrophica]|uniref:Aldo/keto reductase n=1 Tax=Sulfurimonas autotrophica (strain ATCC BAA-671 / DSM 16294 / JCM 11897 / OK10) TaxID=563040 RepID=E0UT81_SULAO|nr:aldo/keto reductase [Sulfurimonas autotrophica]ADN08184.1 aldo/keto reductase [Sulfurimonas autotrophica DSM 16294]